MGILEKYICIFFTYAFLGWCMESIGGYFKTGKFVNRGFLIGTYCPVYGYGVCLITLILSNYVDDIFILFGMSIIICGCLEYFTSWIMEKLFKARWWDYHNRKFNINGRICLETLFPFGILGTVLLKFFNPVILNFYGMIPQNILRLILICFVSSFVVDSFVSFVIIMNFKKTAKQVEDEVVKDNTEEMSTLVKEVTIGKIIEIKDNAMYKMVETKEDIEQIRRRATVKAKILKRNMKYSGNKVYVAFVEAQNKSNIHINNMREALKNSIEESQSKLKQSAGKISNNVKNKLKNFNNREYTEVVIEKLFKKSWFTKRLVNAFPNLKFISEKIKTDKKK